MAEISQPRWPRVRLAIEPGLAIGTLRNRMPITVCTAFIKHSHPAFFHSNNGVEFTARPFRALLCSLGIPISRSKRVAPWANRYQEFFYNKFEAELRGLNRFDTLGALIVEIFATVHRSNTERIRSALHMPPAW
ncbi:MAG: hypothetical protein KGL56_06805 [Alphaproteobacteria bacterium]|nr:hypothetical protein [Alphaproteobacteria bacterium]